MREERKREGRKERGRKEGKREKRRKEGKGRKEGERREKVKEGEGGKKVEERETKKNTTLFCCKNDQLTYHICNLILLPSSSIILFLKSIPGEVEGGREGQRLKSVVAMNQGGLKIGSPQTVLGGREEEREK